MNMSQDWPFLVTTILKRMMSSRLSLIFLYLCTVILTLSGCQYFSGEDEYQIAEKYEQNSDFKKAVKYYLRYIKKNEPSDKTVLAAEKIIKLSQLNPRDYDLIILMADYIIERSNNFKKSFWAQEVKANIYFDDLNQYEKAILEFNKLLLLVKEDDEKKFKYKLKIAKAYFSLNRFYQSEVETKNILKMKVSKDLLYEARLFEANLFLTTKKINLAIESFQNIISDYPEKSQKENLKKNLVVCYEEKEDFEKAISILNEMKQEKTENPELIDLKIEKLKARIANQPRGHIR